MNLILLNGPPRSGKDTASLAIEDALYHMGDNNIVIHEKLSRPLKDAFAGMMQKKIDEDFVVDYYEAHKEETIPSLGVSFRQWQIDFSEKFMKPCYGEAVFGQLLLERLDQEMHMSNGYLDGGHVVVSDCGFQIEVDTLIAAQLFKKIVLIRLHREGCDFSKDSRGYVKAPVTTLDIINTRSIEAFRGLVVSHVLELLK